jgi:hypothetical protein
MTEFRQTSGPFGGCVEAGLALPMKGAASSAPTEGQDQQSRFDARSIARWMRVRTMTPVAPFG